MIVMFPMISMFIVGICISSVSATETGWKKIGESNGIVGYTRSTPKSSIDELKGVGIIDAPVATIEALLRDIPAENEYMYKCKESLEVNLPEHKHNKD